VQVRTGESEEHIVADVAWAACCYLDWTGDRAFAEGPARVLLVETARYWASRIRLDSAGRGHIDGVIGPDEYHEAVDDNAFTNVMARWNLRRAASLAEGALDVSARERMEWLDAAAALVDGFDPQTMLYEQFAGYWKLEPLVIAELAPSRPIAAEILLGRERVQRAQVSKQADVLMLHHMLPDEVAPGSLLPNLAYYEPRTAHGSSLSPGIHASLFARSGQIDAALSALQVASRIDLDDLTGTTAGGLHLASMGSVWQALAFGFLGHRARQDALEIDPHVPERWTAFDLRAMFRGSRVRFHVAGDHATVEADHPMSLRVAGHDAPMDVTSRGRTLARRGAIWEVVT
jgi:trehalose/maltose hydrolase-like predicted phosphorylase